jgi:hypothetical protein
MPRAATATTRDRRWTYVPWLIGAVAVAALLLLEPVREQVRLSFTEVPEPYTALFFDNPEALPLTTTVGRAIDVRYSVRNVEGHEVAYRVTETMHSEVDPTVAQRSTHEFRLPDSGAEHRTLSFVADSPGTYRITVAIADRSQHVSFLVEVSS